MVSNLKCDGCFNQEICLAYKKLKCFTEDARVQLGVDLNMIDCQRYSPIDEDEEVTLEDVSSSAADEDKE